MEENIKIGYKVVHTDYYLGGGSLRYYSATWLGCRMEYKVGEWIEPYPGNGPLAVFDSIESARAFSTSKCIFKVEYEPSEEDTLYFTYMDTQRLVKGPTLYNGVKGTVLAKRVKLLEEVH